MDTSDNGLPAGVVDAVLNRGDLARALNKSEPTIDRYVGDGMPFLAEGTNGRSWEFQLSACWRWLKDRDRIEAEKRTAAEMSVQQMRLALIGGNDIADSDRMLTPRQRQEAYDAERAFMMTALQRGDLVRRADVVETFETLLKTLRDAFIALPDRLEREAGLQGKALDLTQQLCDAALAEAERSIREEVDGDELRQAAE